MKKHFHIAAIAAAVLAVGTAVSFLSAKEQKFDSIFEANIEALSKGEVSAGKLCEQNPYGECIFEDGFIELGTWA